MNAVISLFIVDLRRSTIQIGVQAAGGLGRCRHGAPKLVFHAYAWSAIAQRATFAPHRDHSATPSQRAPMNIGIVTEYYYPLLGGISENVHHVASELVARGHRVTIVSGSPKANGTANLAVPNGIPTVRIGRSIRMYGNGAIAHLAVGTHVWRDLRETLTAGKFDILQLHSPLFFTLPPLAALLGRCPRVGTFHRYFERSLTYSLFKGVLQREFVNRLDGVVAVSPSVLRAMARYFDLDGRIVPNGVDTTAFHPGVPRVARFGPDKQTLLFLGRFDPRNGLSFMLRAFELVRRRRSNVRLLIVGYGPLEPVYKRQVPEHLREDVHFEGPAVL